MVQMTSNGYHTVNKLPRTDASGIIAQARLGHSIDWAVAKEQFVQRLDAILPDTEHNEYNLQIVSFRQPPHTIQRLAELLDEPGKWYTSAPKYLRALDRVLSVTSTTIDFAAEKETGALSVINGEESVLVPIPWLNQINVDELETQRPESIIAPVTGSAPIDATDLGPQHP